MMVAWNSLTNGINGITRPVPSLTEPVGLGLSWIALMVMGLAMATLMFRPTAALISVRIARGNATSWRAG